MAQHSGQHQSPSRYDVMFIIVTGMEIRIRHDGLAGDFVEGDILR